MYFLLCPALRLILCPAYLWPLDVTVLHQGSPADFHRLIESYLLIVYEAVLPKVFLTLFLLLGGVAGYEGGVASAQQR